MKIKGLFMLASIVAISFTACEKDEKDPPADQPTPTPVDTTDNTGNEPPIDFMASKDSADRNLFLEIYTGVRDNSWPGVESKLMVDFGQLKTSYGSERVMVGIIHQGKYAIDNPMFKDDALYVTPYADDLATTAYAEVDPNQISPYSAGSLNRIVSGQGIVFIAANNKPKATVMSNSQWLTKGDEILQKYSSVNIGAKASITGSELKVDVDLYFTGNEAENTYIHVALFQDNLLSYQNPGPQADYEHDHVFRDMVTPGLTGDPVNMTTIPGTWLRRSYTYQIPADYNGPRGGAIVKNDLKVIIYVTKKSNGQIITAKQVLL